MSDAPFALSQRTAASTHNRQPNALCFPVSFVRSPRIAHANQSSSRVPNTRACNAAIATRGGVGIFRRQQTLEVEADLVAT